MAYLNTQLSIQELGFVVDSISLVKTEQSDNVAVETVADVAGENTNFSIASQLRNEKSRLISALSRFPVTALWLLNQYEQGSGLG